MPGFSRRRALVAALALGLAGPARAGAPQDMALGSPRAPVTVIEYGSLSCSHCAAFNNEVFPAFKARYVDTGKVRYVFREFLTDPVQIAAAGALIARCAGKARYFDVIDTFFKGQATLYETGQPGPLFISAGKAGGLSEDQVRSCLSDKAGIAALQARVKRYMETDKINSTPTLIVNGKRLEGEATLEALSAAIDPLLAAGKDRRR